ncbi:molecular chaperone IbpA, HSP20 family [Desulfuromonas soudanensis]|uniref:Molecular chaperone IbpA, HSP20 family n=1 Tax=Desulfuromonas soudanensis TaxID=1603606 RepID=A0A0M5IK77_9BACT|nr:Hsp20/alpha crystallin family protein [Desulfuromonas soudanensis]ALC14861.1 molecular chaperone IbpA, HSP20 family [Desulfuromonas soudanensis]
MTRFALLQEMESVGRDMEQIFRGLALGRRCRPEPSAGVAPPVRLRKTAEGYAVEAALPGVDPATLEMTLLRDTLTLAGERSISNPENVVWHRRERAAGPFERTLRLPEEIDTEKARASFKNGILTLLLPRAQSALPKKIAIEAA